MPACQARAEKSAIWKCPSIGQGMVEPESSHPVNRGPVVTVYLGNNLALSLKLSTCMPTSQSNSSSQGQCQCQRLCQRLRTRRETAEVRSNRQQSVMENIPWLWSLHSMGHPGTVEMNSDSYTSRILINPDLNFFTESKSIKSSAASFRDVIHTEYLWRTATIHEEGGKGQRKSKEL